MIAATVTAGFAYWLSEQSKVTASLAGLDLFAMLTLVWVVAYSVFWLFVSRSLNDPKNMASSQQSSFMTMLYVDPVKKVDDFPPTRQEVDS